MVGKQGDGEMFGNLFKRRVFQEDPDFMFLRWETVVRSYCPICKKDVAKDVSYSEEDFVFIPKRDIIECPDCHIALYGSVTDVVKVSVYVDNDGNILSYKRESRAK